MDLVKRGLAFFSFFVMAVLQLSSATVYTVGDSTGWTTLGNYDYKQWSNTKTFHVGDIIIFKYHTQFHNVLRVTHHEYQACNASAPLDTYVTGNDSIPITTTGHHYFLCGTPGHCQLGQKVEINVLRTSIAPTRSTLPSPNSTPTVAAGPGPSSNNAVSLNGLLSRPGLVVFTILAVFVFGFA